MIRDHEFERRVDADHKSLRAAWVIAAIGSLGFDPKQRRVTRPADWPAVREAAWNVIRRRPATHWRTGPKLIRAYTA